MIAWLVSWWQISQLGLPHRADNGQTFAVVQKFDVHFIQSAYHVRLQHVLRRALRLYFAFSEQNHAV